MAGRSRKKSTAHVHDGSTQPELAEVDLVALAERNSRWRQKLNLTADMKCGYGYPSALQPPCLLESKVELEVNSLGCIRRNAAVPQLLACSNTLPMKGGKPATKDTDLHCAIATSGARIQKCAEIAQAKRWTDVQWASSGNAGDARLLAASEGRVFLFSVTSASDFSRHSPVNVATLGRCKQPTPVVAFAVPRCTPDAATGRLAVVEEARVNLWSMENLKEPIASMPLRVSDDRQMERRGSQVAFSELNERCLLVGCRKGELSLFDVRSGKKPSQLVWAAECAKGIDVIRTSPFVPYWVAVGTYSGTYIFDARAGDAGPVASLRMHSGGVTDLAWAPRHSELIASSSIDGTVKLWDLSQPPHHVRSTIVADRTLPAVGVVFEPPTAERNDRLVVGSISGVISSVELSPKFMATYAPSRCSGPLARPGRKVEQLMYERKVREGLETAVALAKDYKTKCPEEAMQLLSACTPGELLPMDHRLTPQEMMEKEVDRYSYLLPPAYPLPSDIKKPLLKSFLDVQQELKLHSLIKDGRHKELAGMTKMILKMIQDNPLCLGPGTLSKIVGPMLRSKPQVARSFLEQLAAVLAEAKCHETLMDMTALILSPTIYHPPPSQAGQMLAPLEDALTKPKACLAQLEVFGALERGHPVVELLGEFPGVCLSSKYQMQRLEKLLEANQFADVLDLATDLVMKTKGLPFSVTVVQFIGQQVEQRLAKVLIELCTSRPAGTETPAASLDRLVQGAAVIGQFKTQRMHQRVPQKISTLATQGIAALAKAVPAALAAVVQAPDSDSALSPEKQQKRAAKLLAQELEQYAPQTMQGKFLQLYDLLMQVVGHYSSGPRSKTRSPREKRSASKSPRPKVAKEKAKSPSESKKAKKSRTVAD